MSAQGNAPDGGATGERCEHDYEYVLIALNDSNRGEPVQLTPVYECRKCGKRLSPVEYRQQQIMTEVSRWLARFYTPRR